jgi:uncharacterized protein
VSVVYFDTSALVKQYVTELGSSWVLALVDSPDSPVIFTSRLTVIETICAFARRLREGTLSLDRSTKAETLFIYNVAYRYSILDLTITAVDHACQLAKRHPLRAYDAIQLATAWLSNQELIHSGRLPLTFISSDRNLLTVAKSEGLLTENPLDHP